jgi:hypothetical protein
MIALPELQSAFGRSITSDAQNTMLALIAGEPSEAPARLAIYRNNVLSRLTKSLRETFPVVCRLVDERFFDYAADAYIRTALPTEGCLAKYGDSFAAFLAAFPAASEIPYLPDVARLEWSIHRAQLSAPLPTAHLAALASLEHDPAEIRLRLAPWLDYVTSGYNVDDIWSAHQSAGFLGGLRVVSMNCPLQVHGLHESPLRRLTPATWVFRSALAGGETLGEAAARAMRIFPCFDLTQALSTLFSEGCVVGLDLNSNTDPSIREASACRAQPLPSDAGVP